MKVHKAFHIDSDSSSCQTDETVGTSNDSQAFIREDVDLEAACPQLDSPFQSQAITPQVSSSENSDDDDKAIDRFLRENIFRKIPSLNQTELKRLLLEHVGIQIKDTVAESIFRECNTDANGKIGLDQLKEYVSRPDKRSCLSYVIISTAKSLSFWLCLCFLVGSILSIARNASNRKGVLKGLGSIHVSALVAWLFTIGTISFTVLSIRQQRANVELTEMGKKMLVTWFNACPLFKPVASPKTRRKRLFQGSISEPGTYTEFASVMNDPEMKGYLEKFVGDGITLTDLNKILERCSVFLPLRVLKDIFREMDTDGSGIVSNDEIREFAVTFEKRKMTVRDKYWLVANKCLRAWDFWANWLWFLGSACFLAVCFNIPYEMLGPVSDLGCLLYFLGGVSMLPIAYHDVATFLSDTQDLNDALHQLSIRKKKRPQHRPRHLRKSTASMTRLLRDLSGGTEQLQVFHLYDALLDAGVLVPYDVVRTEFKKRDHDSRDGFLDLDEFTKLIASIRKHKTQSEKRCDLIKELLSRASFWSALNYTIAGVLFTVGAYGNLSTQTQANLFLTGSSFYAIAGFYSVAMIPYGFMHHWERLESSKAKLRSSILLQSQAYAETNGECDLFPVFPLAQASSLVPALSILSEVPYEREGTLSFHELNAMLSSTE